MWKGLGCDSGEEYKNFGMSFGQNSTDNRNSLPPGSLLNLLRPYRILRHLPYPAASKLVENGMSECEERIRRVRDLVTSKFRMTEENRNSPEIP